MKGNEFDQHIKSRLKNYESAVPANMWQRITVKEKKRRKGFFLLIGMVMLILLSGGYFFFYNINKNNNVLINAEMNAEKSGSNIIKSKDKEGDKDVHVSSLVITNKKERNKEILQTNKRKQNQTFFIQRSVKKKDKESSGRPVKKGNEPDSINEDIKESDATQDITKDNAQKKEKKLKENKPIAKKDSSANMDIEDNKLTRDRFSIELYGSPAIPFNEISAANKSYERQLQKAGKMKFSYNVGLRFSYEISKKFSAKTGIQYTLVKEKTAFKDQQGNSSKSTNKYNNISVPLIVSYKIANLNNLQASINTGVIINLGFREKGIIPDLSGQPIDIKTGKVYDKNVNGSFYFGIDLSKRINGKTDFFAEPWINYRLKNMVNSIYAFNQRIHSSGLSLGIRYRLFKAEEGRF